MSADTIVAPARPFLKWVGGKAALASQIYAHFSHGTGMYFEPFAGGAAVFFSFKPRRASLTDANAKLMDTYLALQQAPHDVIAHLRTMQNREDEYLRVRANNFSVGPAAQRAAEFIFVNKLSFNGVHRVNAKGQFNVPYCKSEKAQFLDPQNLLAVSEALQGVEIGACDFESAVQDALPGDTVYFDPPYVPLSATSDFTAYTAARFGPDDQRRLRDTANWLKARGVQVVVSNSKTPLVEALYAGWTITPIEVRRSVNSKASGRGPVQEVIISP